MKKIFIFIICVFVIAITSLLCYKNLFNEDPLSFIKPKVEIDNVRCTSDKNKNGIDDLDDIVVGARQEAVNKTKYKDAYYVGGYPPNNEGVCTDVIWRALKYAGYDLKTAVDTDIKQNPKDYSESVKTPDPNIDFRRVKNLKIFFKKYALSLTTEVIPNDKKNLFQWQRGDIVVLDNQEHIGIISDKRRRDGVPYVIHNSYPSARESDSLLIWYKQNRIVAHFRFLK
jgi:uncharacterized protein YijF (DUF1287 family)